MYYWFHSGDGSCASMCCTVFEENDFHIFPARSRNLFSVRLRDLSTSLPIFLLHTYFADFDSYGFARFAFTSNITSFYFAPKDFSRSIINNLFFFFRCVCASLRSPQNSELHRIKMKKKKQQQKITRNLVSILFTFQTQQFMPNDSSLILFILHFTHSSNKNVVLVSRTIP